MIRTIFLLFFVLAACQSFSDRIANEGWNRLQEHYRIDDRSSMDFEERLAHLSRCRSAFGVWASSDIRVRNYLKGALEDVLAVSGWDDVTKDQVRRGTISIGFTPVQVEASWGPCSYTDTLTSAYHERTVMVYRDSSGFRTGAVYLENGRVTLINS